LAAYSDFVNERNRALGAERGGTDTAMSEDSPQ
jgi:hypothetical protein